ncbi:helix-turn-helix domain-containing protein [Pseudidiomarina halophila]|uniref:Transcriptional regulator n=1 Tax=Pseudidiomarina halophila TaxID=1449799 RepID=A0A432XT86_9GAMM|nr:helix-turn-helix domain-containing protein [Pseudidiomarina halophila]RUO51945.1 transcriptional regulator [Pseudidiomarina halophila]
MRLNHSEDIGGAVRAARKALGWSQTELAEKAQTTQAVISNFESSGDGRIDTLLRITQALDLQLLLLQKKESALWED